MNETVENLFLKLCAAIEAEDPSLFAEFKKTAAENPLENSQWENLLDGALKAITVVSVASFDYKLVTLCALFRSWLDDKREEKRKKQQDLTLGVNYGITHPQFTVTTNDPYGGRSYY